MFSKILLPANIDLTRWHGFICLLNHEYYLQVQLTKEYNKNNHKTLSQLGIKFTFDDELKMLLEPYNDIIEIKLKQHNNLDLFWKEIENEIYQKRDSDIVLLKQNNSIEHRTLSKRQLPSYLPILVNELEFIGWNKIVNLNQHFNKFQFEFEYINKLFLIQVEISSEYPKIPPVIDINLPKYSQQMLALNNICKQNEKQLWFELILPEVKRLIFSYTDFYRILQELDDNCKIIEPDPATTKDCIRRIQIEELSFLQVEIAPSKPFNLPKILFFGNKVVKWNQKLKENVEKWDTSLTVYKNLIQILQIDFQFQRAITTNNGQPTIECGICYCYKTEISYLNEEMNSEEYLTKLDKSQAPTFVCSNNYCNKIYHHQCLLQAIKHLPTSRQSYHVWFGKCPYCDTLLSISEIEIE
ncbi:hypothetical protein K502DRAFT_349382 [Neoconidiobolus thromboides FSU 785]|nr:hypothetical protein K502DRAFT_349382 [Neoconidiobolus thromboides FSU 785]